MEIVIVSDVGHLLQSICIGKIYFGINDERAASKRRLCCEKDPMLCCEKDPMRTLGWKCNKPLSLYLNPMLPNGQCRQWWRQIPPLVSTSLQSTPITVAFKCLMSPLAPDANIHWNFVERYNLAMTFQYICSVPQPLAHSVISVILLSPLKAKYCIAVFELLGNIFREMRHLCLKCMT